MYRYNITLNSNLGIYGSRYNVGQANTSSAAYGRLSDTNQHDSDRRRNDAAVARAAE